MRYVRHSERSRGPRASFATIAGSFDRASARMTVIGPTNPAAADDDIAIVNDRGLTGRDRALRLVQSNAGTIVF